MDSNLIERVTEWETRPVSGGYAGLDRLSDEEFSGAVTTGEAWAFLLNGRVIGLLDGTMGDFEGATLTAYAAPDPALPLLFVMREQGGEQRAKYYTNETPLVEADETLSDGGFTGFLKLSENVLSGEYYVVYYGGRSMSVAFVGNNETLRTGDEAFDLAADEVGIYEVFESEITVHEIPEPAVDPEPEAASEPTSESESSADSESEAKRDAAPESAATEEVTDSGADASPGVADRETADDEPESDEAAESEVPETDGPGATAPDGAAEAPPAATDEGDDAPHGDDEQADVTVSSAADGADTGRERESETAASSSDAEADAAGQTAGDDDRFSEEERWRETRVIPSLAPDESEDGSGATSAARPAQTVQNHPSRTPDGEASERVDDLETALEEARTELEELRSDRDRLADERDRTAAERDDLEEEVSRLRERVEELEAERERLESELATRGAGSGEERTTGRDISMQTALDGTNLFVRYRSKSDATLEEAYAGRAGRDEVNENLRLEHHTEFETDGLTVDGDPFEEFLRGTVEFGFVRWLTQELFYEIRETGNERSLDELFAAIPRIDRAELRGTATLADDATDGRTEQSFDVVLRDRMGDPLVVADLNDSRNPATGEMMASLVEGAKGVGEASETLGAAFFVTASFFEPDALEAAAAETGGGLLTRGKRKSFVKLSRKRGFHLSLVETRNDEFHVNVPEL